MSDDYDKLIEKLRKERRRREMTQVDLSRQIGLSHSYIAQVETRRREIKLGVFIKACEVLGFKIKLKRVTNDKT